MEMTALVFLFALLGIPFQAEWLNTPTSEPPKRPKCEVVYVYPGEQGSMESLEEALANGEGQYITICRTEGK